MIPYWVIENCVFFYGDCNIVPACVASGSHYSSRPVCVLTRLEPSREPLRLVDSIRLECKAYLQPVQGGGRCFVQAFQNHGWYYFLGYLRSGVVFRVKVVAWPLLWAKHKWGAHPTIAPAPHETVHIQTGSVWTFRGRICVTIQKLRYCSNIHDVISDNPFLNRILHQQSWVITNPHIGRGGLGKG